MGESNCTNTNGEATNNNNNQDQVITRKETLKQQILSAGGKFSLPRLPSRDKDVDVGYAKMDESVDMDQSDTFYAGTSGVSHTDLLLASTLVLDAKEGRQSDFEMTERSVRLYLIYHHLGLRYMLFAFVFLNHAVAVFEDPAVDGFHLPYWATMLVEFSCLLFYCLRLFHAASFMPSRRFWFDKKNIVIIIIVSLTLVDMSCFLGLDTSGLGAQAHRWSRPLRPIFLVNFSESKQIRRAFRNIRRTLPDILNVLILFFLSIALFSLLGQKLFMKRSLKYPDGSPYFTDYFDIFFDLYVLVTTANNPDVMMPAYNQSHWYALFFIVYILICLYIFMNIFLAAVYNNYRKHLKNEVQNFVIMKRKNLSLAFDLMMPKKTSDSGTTSEGNETLTFRSFSSLMRLLPTTANSPMLISILWFVLDRNGDNQINKADFMQLADLLNVAVSQIKDRKTTFEVVLPKIYNSKPSIIFRTVVAHKYFRYAFDILILVNAALIASDINDAEVAFLCVFTLEILCKIYSFGFRRFFMKFWNIFDFLIIGAAIVATIIEAARGDSEVEKARTLDVLLVLRVLRLVKLVGSIDRFRVIVMTIMNLGPSILTYGGVLFVVFYMFAIVGMELFQGKVAYRGPSDPFFKYCDNPLLNGSAFSNSQYCSNNFNNILNSMVILFELMVVNQWHTGGFVLVTHKAARLYFVAFHLTCVIIVLNIFTAFVLEAFILEYSFSKGKMETQIEKKIEELGLRLKKKPIIPTMNEPEVTGSTWSEMEEQGNCQQGASQVDSRNRRKSSLPNISAETDIRFHISKSRDVENLLQRMFENELDIADIGPADLETPHQAN